MNKEMQSNEYEDIEKTRVSKSGKKKPVKRYVQRKCCAQCRYWYPIHGCNGYCYIKKGLVPSESNCKKWEIYDDCCVKPSEEVIQHVRAKYARDAATFGRELEKVANAEGLTTCRKTKKETKNDIKHHP